MLRSVEQGGRSFWLREEQRWRRADFREVGNTKTDVPKVIFQSFFVHVQANRHADFNSHPPTLIKRVYSAPSLSPLNRVISRFLFLIEEYHTFSFFSLTLHSVSLYKQNMPPIYGCWIVVIFWCDGVLYYLSCVHSISHFCESVG